MNKENKVQEFHVFEEAPPKELYDIDWNMVKRNAYNMPDPNMGIHPIEETKRIIKLYWWCSERNKWDWFPFEKVFKNTIVPVRKKLEFAINSFMDNGLLDLSFKTTDGKIIEEYEDGYDHWLGDVPLKEIRKNMPKIKEIWKSAERYFEVYESLKKHQDLDRGEKIRLFDRVIHLEHDRGNLWGLDDMEHIREEYNEKHTQP